MATDLVAGENQQGIKIVVGNSAAITYMSIGTSVVEMQRGTPVRLLPLGGVAATQDTVASGGYPLARPLILVTRSDPGPLVSAFVAFACSDAAHDLIKAQSFVPVE